MEELTSFTFVDPLYYESLAVYEIQPLYRETVSELVPGSWRVRRHRLWVMVEPEDVEIPEQGFKIHISVNPDQAQAALQRVVPECVRMGICFKLVADAVLLSVVGSKNFGRGSSGKFITIYPPDLATFHELINALYENTYDLRGAYILSDRPYRDSRSVFYRYGGFKRMLRLSVDGTQDPVIRRPDGSVTADIRRAYFSLPDWVSDPFGGEPSLESPSSPVLRDRYEIQEALSFSNSGGIYRAHDLDTGDTVIIKEARPRTANWTRGESVVDAVEILEREHALLEHLSDLPFLADPIELFREWEHTYLVQELVPGIPLSRLRAREDVALIPYLGAPGKTRQFCRIFHRVAEQLLHIVMTLHARGIRIGDLSPNNILVETESLDVHLVDVESAYREDDLSRIDRFSVAWSTPGYRAPGRMRRDHLTPGDDYYSLGMILYGMILPIQPLFELDQRGVEGFLDKIAHLVALPEAVPEVIRALLGGDAERAVRVLRCWNSTELRVPRRGHNIRRTKRFYRELECTARVLPEIVRRVAAHIRSTATPGREDRLWPPDVQAFATNPLNVGYGACGTALFLCDAGGVGDAERDWMLTHSPTENSYPPGLYAGLAGVAYTFHRLGCVDEAADVLDRVFRSPLLYTDPTMFYGVAGWGLVALEMHLATGEHQLLERAVAAGDHLIEVSETRGETRFWRSTQDNEVHLGFAHGASGIGLFLLQLYSVTGESRFRAAAEAAVRFDLQAAVHHRGLPKWGRTENAALNEPYWMHGSAGIGAAVVRFWSALGDEEYLTWAQKTARSVFTRFSVQPSQFEGLSGIGEFFVDMYRATGEDRYRHQALEIADSILCYKVERPEGIGFPGRSLLRLSTDFGFGSAGVGGFLRRVSTAGPRRFHDLEHLSRIRTG